MHPGFLCLQNTYVHILPVEIHVEMCHIPELILHLLLHTGILRDKHSYIKILLVNILRQRSYDIRKSSGLDKRYAFRCGKKNFFHVNPPHMLRLVFQNID